jgi:hypothetical protein
MIHISAGLPAAVQCDYKYENNNELLPRSQYCIQLRYLVIFTILFKFSKSNVITQWYKINSVLTKKLESQAAGIRIPAGIPAATRADGSITGDGISKIAAATVFQKIAHHFINLKF